MTFRILRDAATTEETGTAATTTTATTATTAATTPDPSEGFKLALKKHGDDAAAFARVLYDDHERTRKELESARKAAPKEGSLVIGPDHAKDWADLTKKHKPQDIAQALADLESAKSKIAATERKELILEASRAVGSDNKPLGYDPEVLAELLKDGVIEFKTVKAFGKDAKLPEVVETTTDESGKVTEKRTALDRYAAEKWPKFLPSLKSGTVTTQSQSRVPPTTTNAGPSGRLEIPGIRMPRI